MKIAIDAMGGDLAPDAAVQAVVAYAQQHSDVNLLLVGQEDVLKPKTAGKLPANVSLVHAPSVIGSGDEPVRAVRRKQDSSMVVAAKLVKEGSAQVMISAGNTGALVATGLLVLGRLGGIHRPALAPVLPTFDGKGVLLLDAGATMDAGPDNLLQYAYMGTSYSKYVLGVANPRVGLVNVGAEDSKGNALVKESFNLLRDSSLHFVGNVEARELLDGQVDVVVCDGFVGNVVLKLTEGVGLGIFQALKTALTANLTSKLAAAVLKPSLRAFKDKFDYAEYGGAPFLGVSGGCIKAHGSSNDRAWYTAISQAVRFAQEDLLGKIQQDLASDQ